MYEDRTRSIDPSGVLATNDIHVEEASGSDEESELADVVDAQCAAFLPKPKKDRQTSQCSEFR